MAPLELSRDVNDALQKGDFAAALSPLQSQPHLRVSDFPKVEKKSLTALSQALHAPANAQLWAKALVNTTPSVALFAFRTLVRLGDSIRPLGEPLQKALRDFWENQPPPREGVWDKADLDQRAAQEAMLTRGFEMLLYADVERALDLSYEQAKIYEPLELARQQFHTERNRQSEVARRAIQEALRGHLPDSLKEGQPTLYDMQRTVDLGIYHEVINRPNIQALYVFHSKAVREPQHYPLNTIRNAFSARKPADKELLQLARVRAGAFFRPYLDAGLQKDGKEAASIALAFMHGLNYFNASRPVEEMSAVLKQSRPLVVTLPEEHPTRLLWIRVSQQFLSIVYSYAATVRSEYAPQEAIEMLDLLRLAPDATDTTPEFNQVLEKAKSAYRSVLPEQTTVRAWEQVEEVSEPSVQSVPQDNFPGADAGAISELFSPLHRTEGEEASDFLLRVSEEEKVRVEKVQAIVEKVGWTNDISHSFHNSSQRSREQFQETLASFNEEEKRQTILECCRSGVKQLSDLGTWWQDKSLLQPLVPQLLSLWDQALREQEQARKNRLNPNAQPASAREGLSNHLSLHNIWAIVSEVEAVPGQLRLIQRVLRSRAKDSAWEWEQQLLNPLSLLPWSGTNEEWMAWKLDESVDEALEYLAPRLANWHEFYRERGYSQLAIAFYRRYTDHTRRRCYEVAAQANNLMDEIFDVIHVHNDGYAWQNILSGARQKNEKFFDFWKRWRADVNNRGEVVVLVLEALEVTTSEGGVAMTLQMLGEVELSELASHVALIAQSVESPHPKVAKWAMETLQKMPEAELDWTHIIDMVGEKLWSDNVGLAKVAARFLGSVPVAYALLAWEKLEEALMLDNLALVDACLRSLNQLKRKDPTVTLGTASTERLESLAQLAPERFDKQFARLQPS